MGRLIKSLLTLLAVSALCFGERKKSEKRDIADFGSGFSSSKLEGSGIKISTDFGKEITIDEYKKNGYAFVNDNNPDTENEFKFGLKDNYGNYDFTKNLDDEQQILANLQHNKGILPNTNGVQNIGIQGIIQNQGAHLNQISKENQIAALVHAMQNNQGSNNGDTSSVSYITQNIPVPIPQPYQVSVNQPYSLSVSHPVPVPLKQEIPIPVPQPHPIQVDQQYPVNVAMSVSSVHDSNQDTSTLEQDKASNEEKNAENSIQHYTYNSGPNSENNEENLGKQGQHILPSQNTNQIITHESDTTFNNGFVPSSFQVSVKGHGLFTPQSDLNSRQKFQLPNVQSSQADVAKNLQNVQNQAALLSLAHNQVTLSGLSHNQATVPDLAQNHATLGHAQNTEALSNLAHNQAAVSSLPQNQAMLNHAQNQALLRHTQNQAVLAGLTKNLQSSDHSALFGHSQGFSGLSANYQQLSHGLQPTGIHSALQRPHVVNPGHSFNLQQNLYTNVNSGHPAAPTLQQGTQIFRGQHIFPNQGQSTILNQLQINAPQPKTNGYSVNSGNIHGQQMPENIQQILHTGQNYPSAQQTYNAKM